MASQIKTNALKRDIKISERNLGTAKWKVFLITFLFVTITFGGVQILILYKENIDLITTVFMAKLLGFAIIETIGLVFLVRYFSRKELARMRRDLDDAESNLPG